MTPSSPAPEAGVMAFVRALASMMPGRTAAAIALTLAVSAFEAAGLLLLVELLSLVGLDVPATSVGAAGSAVGKAFAAVGARPTLAAVLLAYVGVMSAQALLQRAQSIVAYTVELQTALRMRMRLYAAVAGARWLAFTRLRASDVVHALTLECDRVGSAAMYLQGMVVQALVGGVYLAAALRVSPAASAVALGCGTAQLLALRRYRRDAREAGARMTHAMAEVVSAAGEHLQGMKLVKSYGAESRSVEIFAGSARYALEAQDRANRAYAGARAGYTVGSVALLAVLAYLAIGVLHVPGPSVLLLVFLFARLVPRLGNFQQMYQHFVHDLPAYGNVERRIASLEAERETSAALDAAEALPLADAVRLEGVTFAYGDDGRDAVEGVTLEIPANATTALVGPSGAGKSTVADLVMGLVRPRAGRVTVDGRPLTEDRLPAWRAGIGYVAQETLLFHDTVRANLSWARPDATEAELWDALRLAAADGFVAALPQGLDTVVGDRGLRLSGGERQRLALARALLRRPSLLILDEATSALDTENERRIREAIRALHGRVTILLITHRLGSVRDADRIHVLEAGRVAESGTFDALLATPGRFRALWESREARRDPAPSPSED